MSADYSVSELCEAFALSRSGYHAWVIRRPCARAQADAQLLPLIEAAHTEGRREYGSPRVMRWLRDKKARRCSRRRVGRLMRQLGLSARKRRRFKPLSLTDSQHDLPIAPNLLSARAPTLKANTVWVADITYIPTAEGYLYLAGVLDRCTRRCVGWAMGDSLATSLPLAALEMALKQRQPSPGLVHHSDRGVQYASAAYRQALTQAALIPSMSRKGNCYDNALMESFWSTLKRGLIAQQVFATRAAARAAIFEWIEVFYNRVRLHSALGFKSPVDFETQTN